MSGKASSREAFLRTQLTGLSLLVARTVVVVYALLAMVMYLRWLPRWLQNHLAAATSAADLDGTFPYTDVALTADAIAILSSVAWMVLAALVFLRRSHDLFGLLLSVSFFSFAVILTDVDVIVPMSRTDSWAPWPVAVISLANGLTLPWAYLFPDGRFVPRWAILPATIWLGWQLGRAVIGPSLDQTEIGPPAVALNAIIVTSAVASVGYRYVRRSAAAQRQQIKWVLFGGLIFLAAYMLVIPLRSLVPQVDQSPSAFLFRTATSAFLSLAVIAIPTAVGIAIFRQGLFDIDLIINRALTYGAITAILAIAFVTVSRLASWLLEAATGERSELVLLASVVPVAIAFVPVRNRIIKIADRFVAESKVITLLFIDLVGSTERAYALGDRSWRELLERFRTVVRRCLRQYQGKEIDTAGDGFFVTFDAPGRAVWCAREIIDSVRPLGLQVRAGAHIGEVQVDGSHVTGVAVHVGSRVMSAAAPGEILVSKALRDSVAGSGIELTDRGFHQLKGVPGDLQLYGTRSMPPT